jgi:hypothetical protein
MATEVGKEETSSPREVQGVNQKVTVQEFQKENGKGTVEILEA